ncbi:MAG: HDOD domain-containing protein [Candidatus Hydrogenedentes bacterium]|nr:HDOD domain-containing protein [Candidatus Hydrogenedentota bacterium]
MKQREHILKALPDVPGLPTAAVRVLGIMDDPDAGIADIMAAVEIDPRLTTNVLKLANSAYFAGPRSIGNLTQAGVLLGSKRIQQLVVAAAIFPVAGKQIRGYDLAPGILLEHLLAVALGTEHLAKALKYKLPGYGFTAALLHDIGKIVLGTFLEIDAAPIVQLAFTEGKSFQDAEYEVLGIDHAETGALLLESWQIPAPIVEVARWHHDPEQAVVDPMLVKLVHVADHVSFECGVGVGVDGLNYRPSERVVKELHLTTTMLEEVACQMMVALETLRPQLLGED